ncbi:MAG: hypothetical protein ACE5EO_05250 [Candidatus Krumholzibacteriia bacterium]
MGKRRAILLCSAAMRGALAVTLGLTAGCLFDTRDAEDPGGNTSSWEVPTVPSRVFLNMESGLEERTGVNYERSLHDVFTFVPLPEDAANPTLAGKFDNWTADVEKTVVNRLTSESSSIEVSFTNREQIRDQNPFADFRMDYELIVASNTLPPDTVIYRGKAQLDMQQGSKGWQLVRWEDIERVSGFASWGFLRGSLRQ